ncbi:unnamed protein product [Musa acuminata var. zebrina]
MFYRTCSMIMVCYYHLFKKHHLVTPEICRKLKNSWNHGEEDDPMATYILVSVEDRWDFPEVPMVED